MVDLTWNEFMIHYQDCTMCMTNNTKNNFQHIYFSTIRIALYHQYQSSVFSEWYFCVFFWEIKNTVLSLLSGRQSLTQWYLVCCYLKGIYKMFPSTIDCIEFPQIYWTSSLSKMLMLVTYTWLHVHGR